MANTPDYNAKALALAVRDDVKEHLAKDLAEMKDSVLVRATKSLRDEYEPRLKVLEERYAKEIAALRSEVSRLREQQAKQDAAFGEIQQKGFDNLARLFKEAQRVQVVLPPDSIKVEQLPSQLSLIVPEGAFQLEQPVVNFTAPKDSIRVVVDQRPSIVNVPKDAISVKVEQKPSVVNMPKDAINIKVKQDAPTLVLPKDSLKLNVESTVIVPPRKTVSRRKVKYDKQTGRPDEFEDITTETTLVEEIEKAKKE